MLAVAPEDVPIPMQVIELLWCAGKAVTPPIGRLGMMKLRKVRESEQQSPPPEIFISTF